MMQSLIETSVKMTLLYGKVIPELHDLYVKLITDNPLIILKPHWKGSKNYATKK